MPPEAPEESETVRPMGALMMLGWTVLATFLHMFVATVVVSIREGAARDLVSGFVAQAIAYGVTLFFVLRVHAPQASIRDFIALRASHWAFLPLALVLGVAATVPADAIYTLVLERFPSSHVSESISSLPTAPLSKQIMYGVILAGLGPFAEEVLFRGALFRPLLRRYPLATCLPLTSLAFTFVHAEPQAFAPIFLMGLLLGLLRAKSGSLFAPFVMHAAFNAVGLVELVVTKSVTPIILSTPVTVAACLVTVFGTVAVVALGRTPVAIEAQETDA